MSLNNVNVQVTVTGGESTPITPTHSIVEVGVANTLVLDANPNRKYLLIANNSDTDMYINLEGDAVVGQGIPLNKGGNYQMSSNYISVGAINAIHNGVGNKQLLVTEGI